MSKLLIWQMNMRPKLIIAGGSAIPRTIDFEKIRSIADSVGAYVLADVAHFAGLIAAGEYPSPFPLSCCDNDNTQDPPRAEGSV